MSTSTFTKLLISNYTEFDTIFFSFHSIHREVCTIFFVPFLSMYTEADTFFFSFLSTYREVGAFFFSFLSIDTEVVEVLLKVHRSLRFIRDGSPERPPRLLHSS